MVDRLETGDLAFFYRPRVDEEHPGGLEDVQRLYLAMRPHDGGSWRLVVVGRKRLPDPEDPGRERFWGFVDDAGDDPSGLQQHVTGEEYRTATRGERHQPEARPAGEGIYAIARHDDHTHLAYELELPAEPGEVQDELGIERQASYVLMVKNPEMPSPPQAGLSPRRRPDYPSRLQDRFGGRRWIAADPTDLLDHPGAEVLLVGAARHPEEELGLQLPTERETASTADLFTEPELRRDRHPLEPLFEGRWA